MLESGEDNAATIAKGLSCLVVVVLVMAGVGYALIMWLANQTS